MPVSDNANGDAPLVHRQTLLLDENRHLLDSIASRNDTLDNRADRVAQLGGLIFSLAALTNYPTLVSSYRAGGITPVSSLQLYLIVCSLLALIAMLLLWVRQFRPLIRRRPGTSDWDTIQRDYIESDDYFNQVLSDILDSISSESELNEHKAKWFFELSSLFAVQIVLLGIVIFLASGS